MEMGFVKGQEVDVLLHAPLRDPIKYKILGYEVSLRRSEADLIEVITEEASASDSKETAKTDSHRTWRSGKQIVHKPFQNHQCRADRQSELRKNFSVQPCFRGA